MKAMKSVKVNLPPYEIWDILNWTRSDGGWHHRLFIWVIFNPILWLLAGANPGTHIWIASLQSVCFLLLCCGCATLCLKNLCLSNKLPEGISAHKSSWRMRQFQNAKSKSKSSGEEGFGRGVQGRTAVWWAQLDLDWQVGDACRTVSVGLQPWQYTKTQKQREGTASLPFLCFIVPKFAQ